MKRYVADIRLVIETDDENGRKPKDWEYAISEYLSAFAEEQASFLEPAGATVTVDFLKVEESKHGFRILVNGEWCEPSDSFAQTVREIEEGLSPTKHEAPPPPDPKKIDRLLELRELMKKQAKEIKEANDNWVEPGLEHDQTLEVEIMSIPARNTEESSKSSPKKFVRLGPRCCSGYADAGGDPEFSEYCVELTDEGEQIGLAYCCACGRSHDTII